MTAVADSRYRGGAGSRGSLEPARRDYCIEPRAASCGLPATAHHVAGTSPRWIDSMTQEPHLAPISGAAAFSAFSRTSVNSGDEGSTGSGNAHEERRDASPKSSSKLEQTPKRKIEL
jgi:hypothetical protein